MSDGNYVWILFYILLLIIVKSFFWLFFWWRARVARAGQVTVQVVTVPLGVQGGAGPVEAAVKPPPYNTLQHCENPPAYDSIFVNKPPNMV